MLRADDTVFLGMAYRYGNVRDVLQRQRQNKVQRKKVNISLKQFITTAKAIKTKTKQTSIYNYNSGISRIYVQS